MYKLISIDAVIYEIRKWKRYETTDGLIERIKALTAAETEIAENISLYKCYITDKEGLQHEVIHTGDIRKVTGWEI